MKFTFNYFFNTKKHLTQATLNDVARTHMFFMALGREISKNPVARCVLPLMLQLHIINAPRPSLFPFSPKTTSKLSTSNDPI